MSGLVPLGDPDAVACEGDACLVPAAAVEPSATAEPSAAPGARPRD